MPDLLSLEIGHLRDQQTERQTPPRGADHQTALLRFRSALREGRLPVSLPLEDDAAVGRIRELAAHLRRRCDTVVVVGIGGSTLGFRAALELVHGPFYNSYPGGRPRVYVVDNVDPSVASQLAAELDFSRTVLVYISKSGSTPEPAANFLVLLERYRASGAPPEEVVIICDPGDNGINRIADRLGCHRLEIPPPLPGRYSVLSAVGLLPCELVAIDSRALLAGARAVHRATVDSEPAVNPCMQLASRLHALLRDERRMHVLFSYSTRLAEMNLWFNQLWSESLGKRLDLDGREVRSGSTPVVAIGATDQHSLLQLLKEGPLDKVIGFVKLSAFDDPVTIPHDFPDLDDYSYLGGHTLAEQLATEQLSTELTLVDAGHPCYTLALAGPTPAAAGAFFYFWELVVVCYAALANLNPFDQPGVEEGKRMTYALMGRRDLLADRPRHQARIAAYRAEDRILSISGAGPGGCPENVGD